MLQFNDQLVNLFKVLLGTNPTDDDVKKIADYGVDCVNDLLMDQCHPSDV